MRTADHPSSRPRLLATRIGAVSPAAINQSVELQLTNPKGSGRIANLEKAWIRVNATRDVGLTFFSPATANLATSTAINVRSAEGPSLCTSWSRLDALSMSANYWRVEAEANVPLEIPLNVLLVPDTSFRIDSETLDAATTDVYYMVLEWNEVFELQAEETPGFIPPSLPVLEPPRVFPEPIVHELASFVPEPMTSGAAADSYGEVRRKRNPTKYEALFGDLKKEDMV